MRRSERVSCVICLAVMAIFCCSAVVRAVTWQVVKHLGVRNAASDIVLAGFEPYVYTGDNAKDVDEDEAREAELRQQDVMVADWAALYPFAEESSVPPVADEADEPVGNGEAGLIARVRDRIDGAAANYLPGYQRMLEDAKWYEGVVRWNYVPYAEYNGVIETPDGYLTTICPRVDVGECAQATVELADFCASRGIGFLYVNAPFKVCGVEDADMSGAIDFSNQNADDFLAMLDSGSAGYLDLRAALHKEGLSHHEAFFRTDHHWKPETGLWASGQAASALNAECGFDIDLSCLDSSQYRSEVYHDWFLGSQGKKVTLSRADPEDIALLYPEFETWLHYEVPDAGIIADGDFSVTYDMGCIEERDWYGQNPYGAYIYADRPLERIENKLVNDGRRVLVVHDSFGNCVVPFLAMGVQSLVSVDLRSFGGSLCTLIDRESPDAVVVLYNAGMLSEQAAEQSGLYDFR